MRFAAAVALPFLLACGAVSSAGLDPHRVAEKLENRFRSVEDYECVMESEVIGPKEKTRGVYRVWFRRPELIRMKVVKGSHRGSVVSLNANGKVRARPGGLLGKVVVKTMDRMDSRLRSPRGTYFWSSHFPSMHRKLREGLGKARDARTAAVRGAADRIQISFTYRDGKTETRQLWTVDSREWLLTGWDVYENGRRVEHVLFRDFRENPGLETSFFDL